MQKIITWFYRAWLRIVYLVCSLFVKKGYKIYERIPVNIATEKDLLRLGRKMSDNVSYSKNDVKPYWISPENIDKPKITSRTMQVIKHKKTGRVVVCPGNLEQIKSMYNSDWEIVESEIKEIQ